MIDEKENDIPAQDSGSGSGSDGDDGDKGNGGGGGNRPSGTRTSEGATGINSEDEESIDPASPSMPPA